MCASLAERRAQLREEILTICERNGFYADKNIAKERVRELVAPLKKYFIYIDPDTELSTTRSSEEALLLAGITVGTLVVADSREKVQKQFDSLWRNGWL